MQYPFYCHSPFSPKNSFVQYLIHSFYRSVAINNSALYTKVNEKIKFPIVLAWRCNVLQSTQQDFGTRSTGKPQIEEEKEREDVAERTENRNTLRVPHRFPEFNSKFN